MSEGASLASDPGPTAAIITIGDEIVEGRVLNENATWLSDELMTRGVAATGRCRPRRDLHDRFGGARRGRRGGPVVRDRGAGLHARRHHPPRRGHRVLPGPADRQ